MTASIITLLVLILLPATVIVYRSARDTDHLDRTPFGFGADSQRIHDELIFLGLHRRDCS